MKINPMNEAALAATAATTAKADRATVPVGVTAEDKISTGTPVTVSAAARSLDAGAVSAGSGIDETKVAAMRAAIADGSFTVNAGAIADKMLSGAQEFLSRARS